MGLARPIESIERRPLNACFEKGRVMPGKHNASSIEGGIFGADQSRPPTSRSLTSRPDSVQQTLFSEGNAFAHAKEEKIRLKPEDQPVAGGAVLREAPSTFRADPNVSSIEGGIFSASAFGNNAVSASQELSQR